MKTSTFNRYIEYDNKILLFNSVSGGFAEIDKDTYMALKALSCHNISKSQQEHLDKYINDLQYGRFIVQDDEDELSNLQAIHNIRKYGTGSLGLTIAPTLACNFQCSYCFEGRLAPQMMQPDVQQAIVDFVASRIKTIGHLNVCWFGGEPLLRKDVIYALSEKFIELCVENDCQYSASIITNGWLLDRQTAENLHKYQVKMVQVTLDGPPEIHDERRPLKSGKGTFQQIISNLVNVVDIVHVAVRINVDKTNRDQIMGVFELLKNHHLLDKVYPYLGHVLGETEACADIQSSCYDTEAFASVEIQTYQDLNARGITIPIPYPRYHPNFCGAVALNAYVIDPQGHIYKCWNHIGNEVEITGNIWHMDQLDYRTAKWLNIQPFDNATCNSCDVLPLCSGGCPDYYHKNKHLSTQRPNCVTWRYYLDDVLLASYRNWKAQNTSNVVETINT